MHLNTNTLPPISDVFWLWIKTDQGELRKVKRTKIIESRDRWEWPCITIDGEEKVFNVTAWAYT